LVASVVRTAASAVSPEEVRACPVPNIRDHDFLVEVMEQIAECPLVQRKGLASRTHHVAKALAVARSAINDNCRAKVNHEPERIYHEARPQRFSGRGLSHGTLRRSKRHDMGRMESINTVPVGGCFGSPGVES
jgi:hypothetical protein